MSKVKTGGWKSGLAFIWLEEDRLQCFPSKKNPSLGETKITKVLKFSLSTITARAPAWASPWCSVPSGRVGLSRPTPRRPQRPPGPDQGSKLLGVPVESNPWSATGQGAPPGHGGEKREIDVISSSVPALQGPLGARIPAAARGSLKSSPFLSACRFSGQGLSRQASCLQELWPWCHVWWC